MLVHPIIDKLQTLRFFGMRSAYEEQLQMSDIDQLNFDERLGFLVDREMTERDNRRFKTRLRKAKLRQNACVEDVDFRYKRGLDKAVFMQLSDCRWIKDAKTSLSSVPRVSVKPIWHVHWHTKPVNTATRYFTSACPGCCRKLQ
jgi:hypothetical protein